MSIGKGTRGAKAGGLPTAFSNWLEASLHELDLHHTDLAASSGLKPEVIGRAFNSGNHSPKTIRLVCDGLLALAVSPELVEKYRATEATAGDRDDFQSKPESLLTCRLKALEKSKPKDRDTVLRSVFNSITPEDRAFLAVGTFSIFPSPFEDVEDYRLISEAIFGGILQGMITLFIFPNEATVTRVRSYLDSSATPSIEDFIKGFNFFRAEFERWCRQKGVNSPEILTSKRLAMTQHGKFYPISDMEILSFLGSSPISSHGACQVRAIKRSPMSGQKIMVTPPGNEYESRVGKWVQTVINDSTATFESAFRDEMQRRLYRRA